MKLLGLMHSLSTLSLSLHIYFHTCPHARKDETWMLMHDYWNTCVWESIFWSWIIFAGPDEISEDFSAVQLPDSEQKVSHVNHAAPKEPKTIVSPKVTSEVTH